MHMLHSRWIALACAAAMLLLTGCRTTVDARWATSDDTVDHWKRAMPKLPVEVRGALPDATNEQIAEVIPNAKATAAGIAVPRLVVELGQAGKPKDDAYCAKPTPNDAGSAAQVQTTTITLAICDGARLVATSSKPLDAAHTPVSALPGRVDNLKKLALIGISRSQIEAYQIQG